MPTVYIVGQEKLTGKKYRRLVFLDATLAMQVMELMTLVTTALSGDKYEVDPT